MKQEGYIKRWNDVFVYDKLLPWYLRRIVSFIIYFFDIYWYFLLFVARLTTKSSHKQYHSSICAIFKDEGLIMKEWIEYHKILGIEHIYLYNNNSTDESLSILLPYIQDNYVTLIDWPVPTPAQVLAYQHFRDFYWEETEWVAFIDLDEFICPKYVLDISDWLDQYKNYPCVTMYWRMFGSSGLIAHDTSKLCIEQYTICWDRYNEIGKPFFNTRFKAQKASLKNIHELPAVVNILGHNFIIPPINEFRFFCRYRSNRVGFKSMKDFSLQLNHYATKSYNEYFITRRKRGDVNGFANNTSVKSYLYTQQFSIVEDKTIFRFIPFLKVNINGNSDIKW